jgi:NAD(P)-dependent dehydrogenase (short-subunit alcohol dehydrogenase family)
MSLKNSRVLVIGGTSGIGLGVATAVAERGAVPIVASRKQSNVDAALARLPQSACGATVDLADEASLDQLVRTVGDIEHLVFTAGESARCACSRHASPRADRSRSPAAPPPNSRDSAPCR